MALVGMRLQPDLNKQNNKLIINGTAADTCYPGKQGYQVCIELLKQPKNTNKHCSQPQTCVYLVTSQLFNPVANTVYEIKQCYCRS